MKKKDLVGVWDVHFTAQKLPQVHDRHGCWTLQVPLVSHLQIYINIPKSAICQHIGIDKESDCRGLNCKREHRLVHLKKKKKSGKLFAKQILLSFSN